MVIRAWGRMEVHVQFSRTLKRGANSGKCQGRARTSYIVPPRRFGGWLTGLCFFLLGPFLLVSLASAQIAPLNPLPGWKQVPSGTGACSLEKSCAEVAP